MTTSGTTAFSPTIGDIGINAFAKCGIRRTELTTSHMQDMRFELNLIMSDWTASGVNLWAVDMVATPLLSGTSTYNVPTDTVFILDVYLSQTNGTITTDRLIFPLSRSDFAAIANKDQQGVPTSYWMDRLLSPTITVWPVQSDNSYTLKYYRATQLQDANLSNGGQPETPYRFLNALSWELAARLAVIYAPDRAIALDARAQRAWHTAISSDTENVAMKVMPNMSGYFR